MAGVAKVIFNNRTLVDVTNDTVSSGTLLAGKTALGADGEVVEGSAREEKTNEVTEGTLDGTYTNTTLVKVGNTGLAEVEMNNSGKELKIELPNVLSVAWAGIYSNSYLTHASLPKAQIIQSIAFQNCTNLTSVYLPVATTVSSSAFDGCKKLETIDLPEITTIGSYAFKACEKLTTATMPKLTKLQDYTFSGCSSLKELNLPYSCSPGAYTFVNCTSIENWVHDSAGIYTQCFQNCSKLSVVDVSSTFNATRPNMFSNCKTLSTFIIRKNSVVALSNVNGFTKTPFSSGGTGGTLYVPQGQISAYESATNWATVLGYTNNKILPIEGSIYEFFFGNGVKIGDWTCEWDYTMGLPSDNGWSANSNRGGASLGSTGLVVTANADWGGSMQGYFANSYGSSDQLILVKFYNTTAYPVSTGGYGTFVSIGDGTNGFTVCTRFTDNKWVVLNTSSVADATAIGDWEYNQWYTVCLVLNNSVGKCFVNGVLLSDNISVSPTGGWLYPGFGVHQKKGSSTFEYAKIQNNVGD